MFMISSIKKRKISQIFLNLLEVLKNHMGLFIWVLSLGIGISDILH